MKTLADRLDDKWRPCIACGKPTARYFFCPCNLTHPICYDCGKSQARKDCAFIIKGRTV